MVYTNQEKVPRLETTPYSEMYQYILFTLADRCQTLDQRDGEQIQLLEQKDEYLKYIQKENETALQRKQEKIDALYADLDGRDEIIRALQNRIDEFESKGKRKR